MAAPAKLQIYLTPFTVNSRKVLAGLDLIGTDYDLHIIDFENDEHKSEAYLRINPHGTVPTAKHGDLIITESNAILMYAADLSKNGSPAYPTDLKLRAEANRWLLWECSVWFQTNYVFLVENVFNPLNEFPIDQAKIEAELPNWHKNAAILDARLAETGGWMLKGDGPSIVDVAIGAPMQLAEMQKLPIDEYPNLKRWFSDLRALPSWVKTQKAIDEALTEDGGD